MMITPRRPHHRSRKISRTERSHPVSAAREARNALGMRSRTRNTPTIRLMSASGEPTKRASGSRMGSPSMAADREHHGEGEHSRDHRDQELPGLDVGRVL